MLMYSSLFWAQTEAELESIKDPVEKMEKAYTFANSIKFSNARKALHYAGEAYELARSQSNTDMMINSAFLQGEIHQNQKNLAAAEEQFKRSFQLSAKASYLTVALSSLNQLEKISVGQTNYRQAYAYSEQAVELLKKGVNKQVSTPRNPLAENNKAKATEQITKLQEEKQDLLQQLTEMKKAQESAAKNNFILQQKRQEAIDEQQKARTELTSRQNALDSLMATQNSSSNISEKERRRLKQQISAKRKEIEAQEKTIAQVESELKSAEFKIERDSYLRNLLLGISAAVLLLAFSFYMRYRTKKKANRILEDKNKIIDEERQRSDELLLNILPPAIAEELKTQGKAKPRKYDQATVLFSDFKNFSFLANNMKPAELVEELDNCFKAFDYIIAQYKIEKIKTIGDAYMCASGLSDKNISPINMVRAALDMQEFLDDIKQERIKRGRPYFEARIGIHTGPVVAGVVGIKKFAYDIWGETVNIAARVEAKSEPGKVNISDATYNLVKDYFDCTPRGKISVKNMSMIKMYFVKALS